MHKHYDGMPGMTAPPKTPDPKKASPGPTKGPTQAKKVTGAPTSIPKTAEPKGRKP